MSGRDGTGSEAGAGVHARARLAISDRLHHLLSESESRWLDEHLAGCPKCRSDAAAYEADRAALRQLRTDLPVPPRDLWARTSAAIERESGFRDRLRIAGRGRRLASPPTVFVAALVAVVVVGTLTSSRLPGGDHPTAQSAGAVALGTSVASAVTATPIPVGGQVRYVSQGQDGTYRVRTVDVKAVCATNAADCGPAAAVDDQPVALTSEPRSVFGSQNTNQLIVVDEAAPGHVATISVVAVATARPDATPSASDLATASADGGTQPPATPIPTVTLRPIDSPRTTPSPAPATGTPAPPPSSSPRTASPSSFASPSATVTNAPSIEASFPSVIPVSPSPTPGGPVLIAQDVVMVGQSAAYSPSGTWFAFTARPSDSSLGSDIYVWKVGDRAARAVTTDHRSSFASWLADDIAVGSTVVDVAAADGSSDVHQEAISYLLDPATGGQVPEPQTGRTWRPSVDPTGHRAIYWTGSLRKAADSAVYLPDAGRLVVGDWNTGSSAPTDTPTATSLATDQADERHETTVAAGRMADWDARWDPTGSKVAVWIADSQDPNVGHLSLYAVNEDGRLDLRKPILDAVRANAGFSISAGKLVWAAPSSDGSEAGGRILVLAWTDHGAGTIETLPDRVVVIR